MEQNSVDNYQEYTRRMMKSMIDKVFFIDKVNSINFVDFGCADGSLLKFIYGLLPPEANLVGYDNDLTMLDAAKRNFPPAKYYNNWEAMILSAFHDNLALICSSTLHEVYHYSSKAQIDEFWKKIFCGRFTYIIIRDMCVSRSIDRPSDINDLSKLYKHFLHSQQLTEFENIWGSVENNKNLVHFLLKYRYLQPNWHREVKENYIPLYREDLLTMLRNDWYEIVYHEHFTLPYIKQNVKDDFDIELKDPTHIKIILRRKK